MTEACLCNLVCKCECQGTYQHLEVHHLKYLGALLHRREVFKMKQTLAKKIFFWTNNKLNRYKKKSYKTGLFCFMNRCSEIEMVLVNSSLERSVKPPQCFGKCTIFTGYSLIGVNLLGCLGRECTALRITAHCINFTVFKPEPKH